MNSFDVGDKIYIANNGGRESYSRYVNCVGDITSVRMFNGRVVEYRVRLPGCTNPRTEDGLFVCTPNMLAYQAGYVKKEKRVGFETGDVVEIKSWEEMEEEFGLDEYCNDIACAFSFTHEMKFLCGKVGTISKISYDKIYFEDLDTKKFTISTDMVKHVKQKNIKIKGEENTMEILKIYKDRKEKELDVKKEKDIEKLRNQDAIYKQLVEIQSKIKNCDMVIDLDEYEFSDEFEKSEDAIKDKYHDQVVELYNMCNEVEAQLMMCETYEQKQKVLKTYKIITDEGKINA